jgi:hypothetical protein
VRRGRLGAVAVALCVAVAACSSSGGSETAKVVAYPLDARLRLNEVQVLASHNSYHIEPDFVLSDPDAEYSHAPLPEQLERQGVRGFELDVLNGPGDGEFQVAHTPQIDANSNCTPLTECLAAVKEWSDTNPGHVPIFILVEPKVGSIDRVLDPRLGDWDADGIERLDRQVRKSLGDKLLTPDDVRGRSRTLRDAVLRRGWPSLAKARGKIVAILNSEGGRRADLLRGRPSLQGRAMFVTADPAAPSAAFIKIDDPKPKRIRELVEQGFIVRTRSDADLEEGRNRDTRRREQALGSGAHIVTTDFMVPIPSIGGDYVVRIPEGTPAGCNPIAAPKRCRPDDVENPRHLTGRPRATPRRRGG